MMDDDSGFMSEGDRERMRRVLQRIRDGTVNAFSLSPEVSSLICLPPDESPHGRLVDILNWLSLISGGQADHDTAGYVTENSVLFTSNFAFKD